MTRKLSFEDAKRQFINRFTMEHVPNWAFKGVREGREIKYYAPQYATDQEWYDNTAFPGEPDHDGSRHYCYSRKQSWPLGQWLSRPYRIEQAAA
jgi:hypothetical protein